MLRPKICCHWLSTGVPLVLVSPLIAVLLGLDWQSWQVLVVTLLLGTPVLSLLSVLGAALTMAADKGGILQALIILPLYIPLLIFASGAMEAAATALPYTGQLAVLLAFLLFALALVPLAVRQALRMNVGSMFRWLDPYAKPETLYHLCGRLLPYLMGLALFTLLLGNIWGLAFSPSDYQQGDSYRIIYIHVPSAIWSMGAYSSMAIAAFIGLVLANSCCTVGRIGDCTYRRCLHCHRIIYRCCLGKPMWGTWWVWDARLTSELVLLFLYLGVIALAGAFSEAARGIKVASLLAIVGVVNLPIIHYSVEWWNTLHQGATITKFAKPSIDPSMLWPLLISLLGFALLLAALTCLRLRSQILIFEQHRPWVRQLVDQQQRGAKLMAFTSWADFWAMGGYALFVWLSFGSTYLLLLGLWWYSKRQHKQIQQQIRAKAAREQRVRQHQEREK